MSVFVITVGIIQLLSVGMQLAEKEPSMLKIAVSAAFAGWAFWLVLA